MRLEKTPTPSQSVDSKTGAHPTLREILSEFVSTCGNDVIDLHTLECADAAQSMLDRWSKLDIRAHNEDVYQLFGLSVTVDASLPVGTVEVRDECGRLKARFINVGLGLR